MKRKPRYVRTIKTRLTADQSKLFHDIRRYVTGFCGKVSDAEVLRYLVRAWDKEDHG